MAAGSLALPHTIGGYQMSVSVVRAAVLRRTLSRPETMYKQTSHTERTSATSITPYLRQMR